jgi:hypothetical protein
MDHRLQVAHHRPLHDTGGGAECYTQIPLELAAAQASDK